MCQFMLVDRDFKVFPDERPEELSCQIHVFKDDKASFQLAYHATAPGEELPVHVMAKGFKARLRDVCLVPCSYVTTGEDDEYYLRKESGMYPDRLEDSDGIIKPEACQWRSLWIDLFPEPGLEDGERNAEVTVLGKDSAVIFKECVTLLYHSFALPRPSRHHTEWFHADCLADYYQVPVFSEEHWEAIENFIAYAVRESGCDMIYTPVFTPPLDTAPGGERTTVQLVKVHKTASGYSFDFSLLERWCKILKKHNVEYIEIPHLFTQWGAKATPKVIIDGERAFGWDVPALSPEYTAFLQALIPELIAKLEELGFDKEHIYFHISDEPSEEDLGQYLAAKDSVQDIIKGCKVFDALSSYELYERKAVSLPVVAADSIDTFIEKGVKDLWVYYCVAQGRYVPNRFIVLPGYRTRALGILMYYFDIKGFLHWGFNFYNSQYSLRHINPYLETDAGGSFPSGDPFLVYPGPGLKPVSSIRGELNREAFRDIALLEGLEKVKGRAYVKAMIQEEAGREISFKDYPQSLSFIHSVMDRAAEELVRSRRNQQRAL